MENEKIIIYIKSFSKREAYDLADRISIDKKNLNIEKDIIWFDSNNILEINLDISKIEKPYEFMPKCKQ